jgi:hypothetical protein
MRLWTIHPKYLDCKGLVACWCEGLLAFNVLKGNTIGYKNHPQLLRFKQTRNPILKMNDYLHFICDEADNRGYKFDRSKLFERTDSDEQSFNVISVNHKQVLYEWDFLKEKVLFRGGDWKHPPLFTIRECEDVCNPMFYIIPGEIEDWEKVKLPLA